MTRRPAMLLLLAGPFVVSLATASGAQAQNYPWCAQYSGNMGGAMNCGFVSFDQCMATARGMGAFCIQNTLYQPPVTPRAAPHPRRRHAH